VARGGLLALLALPAGILVTRRQVLPRTSCGLEHPCRHCKKLDRCQLPGAVKERNKEK